MTYYTVLISLQRDVDAIYLYIELDGRYSSKRDGLSRPLLSKSSRS